MYREKIRDYYEHLSRSYRRVADYILSNYYEVSFMTAAQLAQLVDVDTTTVVRFSQRIGYNGYPELLNDIREQVRTEIYAAYTPKRMTQENKSLLFRARTEQERQNLSQMRVHNPPEHIDTVLAMFEKANHVVLMAEGYAESIAQMGAQQLRHSGFSAETVPSDPVQRAATLIRLDANTLVIGISATEYGRDVAKAMAYAHIRGCATLGIVGSMESPVNRMSDSVIYAPTNSEGPLPSIVALACALSAIVAVLSANKSNAPEQQISEFNAAYQFLTQPENEAFEEEMNGE